MNRDEGAEFVVKKLAHVYSGAGSRIEALAGAVRVVVTDGARERSLNVDPSVLDNPELLEAIGRNLLAELK